MSAKNPTLLHYLRVPTVDGSDSTLKKTYSGIPGPAETVTVQLPLDPSDAVSVFHRVSHWFMWRIV